MTRLYHVLPAADRDLDDQAAYLAMRAGLDIALRFYDATATTFSHIGRDFPRPSRFIAGQIQNRAGTFDSV